MAEVQVFNYEGSPISFENGEVKMVNATQMAKPFGKLAKDWLVNKNTKEFLEELSTVRRIPLTELVVILQGGVKQGTWMHEDVAIEFARWLSPKFAIWCNDRIKELAKNGYVDFRVPKTFREALLLAAEQQGVIEEQQLLISQQKEQINEQAPKVTFADAITGSQGSILIGELAKLLTQNGVKIGQNRLFEWLRNNGYLGKGEGYYNRPNQKYVEQKLFEIKEGVRSGKGTNMEKFFTTKVTGKGQEYFVNGFLSGRFTI